MTDADRDNLQTLFASQEDPTPDEGFVRTVSRRAAIEHRARSFAAGAARVCAAVVLLVALVWLGPSLLAAANRWLGASGPYLVASLAVASLSLTLPRLVRLIRS